MPSGVAGRSGRLTLGVAIVGYGAIAHEHAAALAAGGVRLVTVAGPDRANAARFAADHGIEAVDGSLEAVLARDDVEAVVVASPSVVHAEQAATVLGAGRHVLVEIPLALSLAEGERIAELAAARGLLAGVCHTLRFWEPYRALADALAGTRPRVRHVIARRLMERRDDRGATGRARSWTDDVLWHHGGHVIDAVLAVLPDDPVVAVTAVAAEPDRRGARRTEYAIGLRTASGAIASIALSYGSRIEAAELQVLTDGESWAISDAALRSSRALLHAGTLEQTQAAAIGAQDAAFVAACRGAAPFPIPAASVLPTLRVQQQVADLIER